MILGHECCGEVVKVGELVKDFKPGDRVLVPAITPDWNSLEAQAGYSMHSGGMLAEENDFLREASAFFAASHPKLKRMRDSNLSQ